MKRTKLPSHYSICCSQMHLYLKNLVQLAHWLFTLGYVGKFKLGLDAGLWCFDRNSHGLSTWGLGYYISHMTSNAWSIGTATSNVVCGIISTTRRGMLDLEAWQQATCAATATTHHQFALGYSTFCKYKCRWKPLGWVLPLTQGISILDFRICGTSNIRSTTTITNISSNTIGPISTQIKKYKKNVCALVVVPD